MTLWIPWDQADRFGRLLLVAAAAFSAWAVQRALGKVQYEPDPHGELPLDRVAAQAGLLWLALLAWNLNAKLDFTERLLSGLAALFSAWFALALGLRLAKKIRLAHWFYDWSWSGFSAVWLALIIRATLVEPYNIPSESMVPTLRIADHLFVSKTTYGWKVPGIDKRVLKFRDVKRGEIVIFVPPHIPHQSYVKRCVGLPGDTVEVKAKRVYINGQLTEVPQAYGRLSGVPDPARPVLLQAVNAYMEKRLPELKAMAPEKAQAHSQRTTWLGPLESAGSTYYIEAAAAYQRAYGRLLDQPKAGPLDLWPKEASTPADAVPLDWARDHKLGNRDWFGPYTLKPGEYWMMGDNRDNSSDSRYFGPVSEGALRGTPLLRYWPLDRLGRPE